MKDSGKWAVVFTVLNIILIVTCVVLLLGRDRKAPVISFSENDLIYYSGIDNEKLLQGVAAMDAKNGDVSDRIVVEKIVQNKNEDRAVVYYAVTDLDGNAAKASRVFEAVNEATGDAMKDIGMAGFDGDMDGSLPGELETLEPADAQEEELQATANAEDTPEEDTEAESSPSVSPTPDIEEQRRKEQEEADRKAQEEEEQRRSRRETYYGKDANTKYQRLRRRHIYIFNPEDLDNADIISMVENSPTYLRDKSTLAAIKVKAEEAGILATEEAQEAENGGNSVITF